MADKPLSIEELSSITDIQKTLDNASVTLRAFLLLISPNIIDGRPYHFNTEDTFEFLLSILDSIDSARGRLLRERKTLPMEKVKVCSVSMMEKVVLAEAKTTFHVEEKDGRQQRNELTDGISNQTDYKGIPCPEESSQIPGTGDQFNYITVQGPETQGKIESTFQEGRGNERQTEYVDLESPEDVTVEGCRHNSQTENITKLSKARTDSLSENITLRGSGDECRPENIFQQDPETEDVTQQGSLTEGQSEDITAKSQGTDSLSKNVIQASVTEQTQNITETSQAKNVHGDD